MIHVHVHFVLSIVGLDTVLKEFNEAIEQSRENSTDASASNNAAAAVASGERQWLEREAIQQGLHPRTGAILLAVCRGKVSEGIDFSDGKLYYYTHTTIISSVKLVLLCMHLLTQRYTMILCV
jgi:Helicase C-terminal domain